MKKIIITLAVALATFTFAKAQDIETAVNLYNEAGTMVNEGNLADALPKFLECLEMAKSLGDEASNVVGDCQGIIPQIYMKLGEAAAEESDFDAALENFRKVVETATEYDNNPDVLERATGLIPKMLMAKGGAMLNAKNFAEAVEAFKAVVEADPENTKAMMRLGHSLVGAGDVDAAIETFTKAAEVAGEDTAEAKDAMKQISNCYLKKAVACQKSKDNRGCMENAQKSAQAMDSPNAQKLIGVSALNLKQFDTAIGAFEAYLALAPNAKDNAQIIYQLATAYEGRKDRAKACAYYKQILNDPKFGPVAKYKVEEELKCNQ
ncbi:MAG: tetratricopeptide repeat protein [Bacteroidales bacterium]|nr:tetratricopeptide repeat protein [Bacteroidales bacterium]